MTSVLLPTIRPENIEKTLGVLLNNCPSNMEVIVIADFARPFADHPQVKWILEPKREGPTWAINRGYAEAQGQHIFVLNDESLIEGLSITRMEQFYEDKLVIGGPTHKPFFPFAYYGLQFSPFPFVHRKTVDYIWKGVSYQGKPFLFNYQLRAFYADPDFSLRAWEAKIPIFTCDHAILIHSNNIKREDHQTNVSRYLEHDREIFRSRWDRLGEFRDP